MEKIVKTTYKVPVLEYANLGWQGTAKIDCSEFETFDRAALFELLCKEILRTVIDDYIVDNGPICNSNWESFQYDVERFFKGDVIISELFTSIEIRDLEEDSYDDDDIHSFVIVLHKSKELKDNIYLTFEY